VVGAKSVFFGGKWRAESEGAEMPFKGTIVRGECYWEREKFSFKQCARLGGQASISAIRMGEWGVGGRIDVH